jgi:hypothetical protein
MLRPTLAYSPRLYRKTCDRPLQVDGRQPDAALQQAVAGQNLPVTIDLSDLLETVATNLR